MYLSHKMRIYPNAECGAPNGALNQEDDRGSRDFFCFFASSCQNISF